MKQRFSLASFMGIFSLCMLTAIVALPSLAASDTSPRKNGGLVHDAYSMNPVPLPLSELGLQTVEATPLIIAGNKGQTLEGAIFDADGNLLFCNVTDAKVMRLTPDGKLSTLLEVDGLAPGGLAMTRDGQLFIAAINQANKTGAVFALLPDGKSLKTIISPEAGYLPNDLVLDANGGFYFSDFNGSATTPLGGVYYVSPDFQSISPVIPHMAQANGVALSPDGKLSGPRNMRAISCIV